MIDPPKPKNLRYTPGVGLLKAQALEKLGVTTERDLLEYFPRDWTFAPKTTPISNMTLDERVVIAGQIVHVEYQPWRNNILRVTIADESADCELVWYHGGFLRNQLRAGVMISAFGTVKWYMGEKTLINPKFILVNEHNIAEPFNGPVYPASAKISSESIKYIIRKHIDIPTFRMPEYFTDDIRYRAIIIPRTMAYTYLHNPSTRRQLNTAKRRIKFDELFFMQLGLALRRHQQQDCKSTKAMKWTLINDATIRMCFPFVLTVDQRDVITEIVHDMERKVPMNRLLQGDVDSGKTAVAMYAAMLAVLNGTQVAIMAPTQILAEQHFSVFQKFLAKSGLDVTCRLAVGNSYRACTIDIDIIIGTTAILNKNVKFRKLGLIIIDEQHRFGVEQRLALRKGKSPHCLVMTATPIPRTLAMTAFGDLDVSTIRKRLPGRGGVVTRWVKESDRDAAYEIIGKKMEAGEQVFWVCPRIGHSKGTCPYIGDISELGAEKTHLHLSVEVFPNYDIGLLHSQLSRAEKDQVINEFREGTIDMLVSTSIVEVGIDISNATVMVVEEANRFGAAQLHQLRGRVGRGSGRSYCFLFSDTTEEDAVERLELMTQTDDGFVIAEHDLKLRGPGTLFDTKQHGLTDLKLANLLDDYKLLMLAREIAFEMVEADPTLEQHKVIRTELKRKLEDRIELGDTG